MSSHIVEHFWWPDMLSDIAWFVKTCLLCQLRQTKQILIPPTVPLPAPLFAKMHMDTMHLPASGGFKYIVQGRCTLSHWPEFRCLRAETAHTLSEWIYQDVLCRWGTLSEIVTDNGPAFVKACEQLSKKYMLITSVFWGTTRGQTVLSSDHTSTYGKLCSKRLLETSRVGVSPHTLSFGQTA